MTCYKFQLKSSKTTDGYPRFEKGDSVTAYYFEADSTGTLGEATSISSLKGATHLLAGLAATFALLMSF